jgi:hypothetical protein
MPKVTLPAPTGPDQDTVPVEPTPAKGEKLYAIAEDAPFTTLLIGNYVFTKGVMTAHNGDFSDVDPEYSKYVVEAS